MSGAVGDISPAGYCAVNTFGAFGDYQAATTAQINPAEMRNSLRGQSRPYGGFNSVHAEGLL